MAGNDPDSTTTDELGRRLAMEVVDVDPGFWDLLVVDEKALRSLAELPDEVPGTHIVSLRERLVSFFSSLLST